MDDRFTRCQRFMTLHARLLERRIFEVRFQGAPASSVAGAVRAYRNADGGLGHALEPDVRCGESQPLFAEVGLAALCDVEFRDPDLALSVCGFLESVADERGLVPAILENARSSPLAAHWGRPVSPGLNPTSGICGLLHCQGVEHPWLTRATETCCEITLDEPPLEAHTLLGLSRLAQHLPDRAKAERLTAMIAAALPKASFFIAEAPVTGYGLTPLHFASSPESPWQSLFTKEQIDGHLEDLLSRQEEDGGWPIGWQAPSTAAASEWRGRWTLEAIGALVSYGRVAAPKAQARV